MADVLFILVTLAFFALCALYVRFCDRIITSGEPAAPITEITDEVVR
jgi:hypothetical protein